MVDSGDKKQAEVAEIVRGLAKIEVEAPPFLETRVLAIVEERTRSLSRLSFWKRSALAAGLCFMALSVFLFTRETRPQFHAFVNQPFVVRVSVSDLTHVAIARAEIALPDGVYFDLEDYPELRERRTLSLVWSDAMGSELVPFVLKSHEGGVKTVAVRFFDAAGELLREKRISIDLREDV